MLQPLLFELKVKVNVSRLVQVSSLQNLVILSAMLLGQQLIPFSNFVTIHPSCPVVEGGGVRVDCQVNYLCRTLGSGGGLRLPTETEVPGSFESTPIFLFLQDLSRTSGFSSSRLFSLSIHLFTAQLALA